MEGNIIIIAVAMVLGSGKSLLSHPIVDKVGLGDYIRFLL